MTNPWSEELITNFVIPSDADPGEARIELDSVLPPPLDTYTFTRFGGIVYHYVAVIVFYRGEGADDDFDYIAIATGAAVGYPMMWHIGTVVNGAVVERSAGDPMVLEFGDQVGAPPQAHQRIINGTEVSLFQEWINTFVRVISGGIRIQSDSQGANLQFIDLLAVNSGGVTFSEVQLNPNGGTDGVLIFTNVGTKNVNIQSDGGDVLITANGDDVVITAANDVTVTATDDITLIATNQIELQANDVDFDASPRVGPNGSEQNAYLPFATDHVDSSGTTTISATSAGTANTIAGCTKTITIFSVNDIVKVRGDFDVAAIVNPTSTFDGILDVDGTIQTGHCTYRTGTNGERVTTGRTWQVTGLAAGNHTFTLKGFAGVANQYATQGNSCIDLDPRYH